MFTNPNKFQIGSQTLRFYRFYRFNRFSQFQRILALSDISGFKEMVNF